MRRREKRGFGIYSSLLLSIIPPLAVEAGGCARHSFIPLDACQLVMISLLFFRTCSTSASGYSAIWPAGLEEQHLIPTRARGDVGRQVRKVGERRSSSADLHATASTVKGCGRPTHRAESNRTTPHTHPLHPSPSIAKMLR
ncbi:hypothetical protein F4821DRAFT_233515 [Hypoxylon rubiginosum]|uniref:Uncharacterized protein n=1 Tax=Hypoxylon rubiginosum TaxID=110542 RepID=A0ACC0D7Z3_9PEZI|nr:hypothetical protein F4821DRAFT_233515 [Hypoxylon rubiginosum]